MLGYACINETLKKDKIFTSRTMRKKTFQEKGLDYVSELSLQNCKDLLTILQWNEENDIRFFRMSSNFIPWFSEFKFNKLKDATAIEQVLSSVGKFATLHGHRLTMHPDHFCKLASPKKEVLDSTLSELEFHGFFMDMIGLSRSHYNKINIHVGAAYNDKKTTANRFCDNFSLLSESVQSRLTVENDDRESLYTTQELHDLVYTKIGIPIVFDYHHHNLNPGSQSIEDAFLLALETWDGKPYKPVIHYSESKSSEYKDDKIKPQAHSDMIQSYIDTFGFDVDIMIEAKKKELSLLYYRELYNKKEV